MAELTIEYNKNKCVGAKKCIEVAGKFFSFEDGRANLIENTTIDDLQTLKANFSAEDLEKFRKSAELCPVNAIKVMCEGKSLISTEVIEEDKRIIEAEYDDLKEFVMDSNGYFLIRIDKEKKLIEVGLCRESNKVTVVVKGKKPIDIYQTVIKNNLITRMDHAAYLGRELQKAYIALQKDIDYVQDDELNL